MLSESPLKWMGDQSGRLKSLAEGRAMIRSSFDTKEFEPKDGDEWRAAYERFCELLANGEER